MLLPYWSFNKILVVLRASGNAAHGAGALPLLVLVSDITTDVGTGAAVVVVEVDVVVVVLVVVVDAGGSVVVLVVVVVGGSVVVLVVVTGGSVVVLVVVLVVVVLVVVVYPGHNGIDSGHAGNSPGKHPYQISKQTREYPGTLSEGHSIYPLGHAGVV
jgi:hypothetical protein